MRVGRIEEEVASNPIGIPVVDRLGKVVGLVHVRRRPRALQGEDGEDQQDLGKDSEAGWRRHT